MKTYLSVLLIATTLPYAILLPLNNGAYQSPHGERIRLQRRQAANSGYNHFYPNTAFAPNTKPQYQYNPQPFPSSPVKIRSPRIETQYSNTYSQASPQAPPNSQSTFFSITAPPTRSPFSPPIFTYTSTSSPPQSFSSPTFSKIPSIVLSTELTPPDTTSELADSLGRAIDPAEGYAGIPSASDVKKVSVDVNNNVNVG